MSTIPDKERYRCRLRERRFQADEPIDLYEIAMGDVGTWDIVEKRFVKRNERGEWVPE